MGAAAVVVLLPAVLLGLLWWNQRSLVYVPDRAAVPPAGTVLPGARDVELTTSDGLRLGAWYLPASGTCDAAVLVAPGNGGNRAGRAGLARALGDRGFAVLLLDYRGYGGNPGRPDEDGVVRDARAAWDALLAAGHPADRVVVLGESLGAAVGARLAADVVAERPAAGQDGPAGTGVAPAALVLRSPFTSLADAGRAAYGVPVGWLLRDRFPVTEHAEAVAAAGVPVAVVHGSDDAVVPATQSARVAQAARDAGGHVVERSVDGAGHNDAVLAEGPALLDAVVEAARSGGVRGCG